ncbi:MAG: DnaJ C-terminal domain-containing protein [Desulfovibrionaceae bacterium]|nr:DnaJ C-terminal domain-containing protein [Desulfovibrionaceae bacterium]
MAAEYKDYYKILNVSRTANKDEIGRAFKRLAKKYHPDLNQNDPKAEEKFKEINEAYEVLKDEEKRRLYDQLGSDWQQGQQFRSGNFNGGTRFSFNGQNFGSSGFSDFFETLFGSGSHFRGSSPFEQMFQAGGSGHFRKPSSDINASLDISIEEAVSGTRKSLSLHMDQGIVSTLQVNIPAGVKNGSKLRLAGKGRTAQDGSKGDLYLTVRLLPNSKYTVEGDHLIHTLTIDPWQAVLGSKVRVPTPYGEVEMSIPAGTDSGSRLRLHGKGLGKPNSRGDEYVDIVIRIPKKLTERQRQLWQSLADEK